MTAPAAIAVTPPPVRKGVPWVRIIAGVVIAGFALYLPQVNNPENNTIFARLRARNDASASTPVSSGMEWSRMMTSTAAP